MVASPTKKEYIAHAKTVIEATARYLGEWTEHQVQNLAITKHTPYIWPLGDNGYAIGHRRVMFKQGQWQLQNTYQEILHIFDQKLSAVFYALCDQKGYYQLAQSIMGFDNKVLKLKNDIVYYESSLNRAIKNKKFENAEIWRSRLNNAQLQLKSANIQLQKSLTSAKYIKYWEQRP